MSETEIDLELPQFSDFEDSLVAFIDILGFDNRAKGIGNGSDFESVSRLLFAVKETAKSFTEASGLFKQYRFTAISDSVIASVPFSDPICTVGMLHILGFLQYEFLGAGYETLVRGFITKGPIYHRDGILFGAGYSNAYKGESKIGSAPRIVLDPSIVAEARTVIANYQKIENPITIFDHLKEDSSDGLYFIDYLNPAHTLEGLPKEQLLHERHKIKEFVANSLSKYESDLSICVKYKWLENYLKETDAHYE